MKLRTEMLHTWHLNKPKDYVFGEDAASLMHDVAAAHALMQAIEDAEDRWFVNQKDHTDWIKEKADKLMREWTNQSEV